jgi:hypothetical protein
MAATGLIDFSNEHLTQTIAATPGKLAIEYTSIADVGVQ